MQYDGRRRSGNERQDGVRTWDGARPPDEGLEMSRVGGREDRDNRSGRPSHNAPATIGPTDWTALNNPQPPNTTAANATSQSQECCYPICGSCGRQDSVMYGRPAMVACSSHRGFRKKFEACSHCDPQNNVAQQGQGNQPRREADNRYNDGSYRVRGPQNSFSYMTAPQPTYLPPQTQQTWPLPGDRNHGASVAGYPSTQSYAPQDGPSSSYGYFPGRAHHSPVQQNSQPQHQSSPEPAEYNATPSGDQQQYQASPYYGQQGYSGSGYQYWGNQ